MNINQHILKIASFAVELPDGLDRNKRCHVLTEVEIDEVSTPDNQDGTYNQVYKAKVSGATDVKQGEAVVKTKDKSNQSKLTRGAIWNLQNSVERMDVDQDVFYTEVQKLIRRHLPEIYEQYKHELTF